MTPEIALGMIIRERRLELGLSQEDIEDEGLDQSHISKLERGQRQLGIRGFITLAGKLKMEPWILMKEIIRRIG